MPEYERCRGHEFAVSGQTGPAGDARKCPGLLGLPLGVELLRLERRRDSALDLQATRFAGRRVDAITHGPGEGACTTRIGKTDHRHQAVFASHSGVAEHDSRLGFDCRNAGDCGRGRCARSPLGKAEVDSHVNTGAENERSDDAGKSDNPRTPAHAAAASRAVLPGLGVATATGVVGDIAMATALEASSVVDDAVTGITALSGRSAKFAVLIPKVVFIRGLTRSRTASPGDGNRGPAEWCRWSGLAGQ